MPNSACQKPAVIGAEPFQRDRAGLALAQRQNLVHHGTMARELNRS